MKTIEPSSFAMICFLVLMQNGDGLIDKSPDYIDEKMSVLHSGLNAFSYLDIHNMHKVIDWCDQWGVQVPEIIRMEMAHQDNADLELKAMGFDL